MPSKIIDQTEEEFGEPFWDVVRGFAADNYACDTTAKILGYAQPNSFRRLIKSHGVKIDWPAHGSCNAQKYRGPHSVERAYKIKMGKLENGGPVASAYLKSTGESVMDLALRLHKDHTATEVAKIAGWKRGQWLKLWLKARDVKLEFKRVKPKPPSGLGWQAEDVRDMKFLFPCTTK